MSHQLNALERQLKDAKAAIKRREAILRLKDNPDFKEYILEGFAESECARYLRESTDPALGERQRADALAMAQASGHLIRFLNMIVMTGNQAEDNSQDIENAIEEARAASQDESEGQ